MKTKILKVLETHRNNLQSEFDNPESDRYDDGAAYWDIEELEELIEQVKSYDFTK